MGCRQRWARQPEGNVKLIPILQFLVLSLKKKKGNCVFVLVDPVRRNARSKPSTAGNLPVPPNRHGHNGQSWRECNGDTQTFRRIHTYTHNCGSYVRRPLLVEWILISAHYHLDSLLIYTSHQTDLCVCNLNKD